MDLYVKFDSYMPLYRVLPIIKKNIKFMYLYIIYIMIFSSMSQYDFFNYDKLGKWIYTSNLTVTYHFTMCFQLLKKT